MKSMMMILWMICGLAISQSSAQACKTPCTPSPSCCAKACTHDTKGTAAVMEPGTAVFASCSPEAMAACEDKKMSKKEMKECQAKCTAAPGCQAKGTSAVAPATSATTSPAKPSKG